MTKQNSHKIRNAAMVAGVSVSTLMAPFQAFTANASTNQGVSYVKRTAVVYNQKHKMVGTIKKGTTVKLLKAGSNQSYIQYGKKKGYVFTKTLGYKTATKTTYQAQLKVKADLKQKASAKSKTLISVGKNTTLKIAQAKTNTKWLKVTVRNLTGYVLSKDVSFKKTTTPSNPKVVENYVAKPLTNKAYALTKSNQAQVDKIADQLKAIESKTAKSDSTTPVLAKVATSSQNSSAQSSAVTSLKAANSQLSSVQTAISSVAKSTSDETTKSNASVVSDKIDSQVSENKSDIKSIASNSNYATEVAGSQYQQVTAQKTGISNANVALTASKVIKTESKAVSSASEAHSSAVSDKDSSAAKSASKAESSATVKLTSAQGTKSSAQSQLDLSYRDAFSDDALQTESLNSLIDTVFYTQDTDGISTRLGDIGDNTVAPNSRATNINQSYSDNTTSTGQMSTGDSNANSNYLSNSDHSGWSSYDSDTASKVAFDNKVYTNDSAANSAISSANSVMLKSLAAAHGGQPTVTSTASNAIYVYPDGTTQTLVFDATNSSSNAANDSLHSTMASAANSAALQSMSSLHGSYSIKSQPDQTTYVFADGYTYERENDLDWLQKSTASNTTDINAVTVVSSGSTAKLSAVATSDTNVDSPVYEQAMIDQHGSEYTVNIGGIIYQSYADGTKVAVYDNRANVDHGNSANNAEFASYSVSSASSSASSNASSGSGSGATSSNNSINPTPSGISSDQLASVEAARLASLASAEAKNGVANPYVNKHNATNSNTVGSNGLYDSDAANKVYNSLTDGATQVNFDTSTADKTDHNQAHYAVSAHSTASNADANSAHSLNPREIDSSASRSMASSEASFYASEMAVMHSNSEAIDSTQVSINSMTSSAAKSYQAVQDTANSYNHDLASATDSLTKVRRSYEIADSTAFSYAMDADKATQSNETTKASNDSSHATSWAAVRDSLAPVVQSAVGVVQTLTSQTDSAENAAINSSNQANSLSTSLNTMMSSTTSSLEQSNTYMSYFAAKQAEIYNSYARTDPNNDQLKHASDIAASYAKSFTDGSVAASLSASSVYASSVAQSKAISDAAYAASLSAMNTSIATALSDATSLANSVAAENDYNYRSGMTDSYNAIINSMTDSVNADLQNIDGDAIKAEIQSYADSAHALASNLPMASSAINDMGNRMEHAVQSEMTKSMNAAEPRNVSQN